MTMIQRVVPWTLTAALLFAAGFYTALLALMTTTPFQGFSQGGLGTYLPVSVTEECRYVSWMQTPETGSAFPGLEQCEYSTCNRAIIRTVRVGSVAWTRSYETLPGWRGCEPPKEGG